MAKSILQLRMEGLDRNLAGAQNPHAWLSRLDLAHMPDRVLWLIAVQAIAKEADDLLVDLRKGLDKLNKNALPPAAGWDLYLRIQTRSDELFREFLTLLGGLTLRDRLNDEFVCRFADELIGECAESVGKHTSFAIPAFEDTLSSTLRRVARIGFPDWDLWALPLATYEYSQVVIRETTSLVRLITELATRDIKDVVDKKLSYVRDSVTASSTHSAEIKQMTVSMLEDADASDPQKAALRLDQVAQFLTIDHGNAIPDVARSAARQIRRSLDEAKSRFQVLVADAFATFTCGPAYACATVIFRLNPVSPRTPSRPADQERAALILSLLLEMDNAAPPEFSEVHANLSQLWETLSAGTGHSPNVASTIIDAKSILERIRGQIVDAKAAEFSSYRWSRAKRRSEDWLAEINGTNPTPTSGSTGGTRRTPIDLRLRDVLNAAWQCRLTIMDRGPVLDVEPACAKLTQIARASCEEIAARRAEKGNRTAFGGQSMKP